MNSEDRRHQILKYLQAADEPVSGSELAEHFSVTRQVIVKDMGILKASGQPILSTARGYLLQKDTDTRCRREITVCHQKDQIADELQRIVDLGGHILYTHVNHPIYGSVGEALRIKSKKDILQFLHTTEETGCMPLLELTNGVHTHTIAAEDEQTLDEICAELRRVGYLLYETDAEK